MKTKKKQSSHSSTARQAADPMPLREMMSPMEEDPFYGHSEWVDPEMKQTVAQEARRMSHHGGKTIRRPQGNVRTMGA